jgi:hypothetical protein
MRFHRQLTEVYCFPGFRPLSSIRGIFGDPKSCVVRFSRRGKKANFGACLTVKTVSEAETMLSVSEKLAIATQTIVSMIFTIVKTTNTIVKIGQRSNIIFVYDLAAV